MQWVDLAGTQWLGCGKMLSHRDRPTPNNSSLHKSPDLMHILMGRHLSYIHIYIYIYICHFNEKLLSPKPSLMIAGVLGFVASATAELRKPV